MPRKPKPPPQPLLAIDGDSFAHRAYHALPKTIRRTGSRPAGASLGFANLLLRLYRDEKPRAVIARQPHQQRDGDAQRSDRVREVSGLARGGF